MRSRLAQRLLRRLRRPKAAPLPSERATRWPETPAPTVESYRAAFDTVTPNTVGVEEEFLLVVPDTLELAPVSREILERLQPSTAFHAELRAAQIELVTPVLGSAASVGAYLGEARRELVAAASGLARVVAAGTHPFAKDWGELTASDRYRLIEDEYSWAARRSLACGLHIHVAVGGAERSLAVFNALRSYLPEIAAVATNSPFLEGEDTGLASVRPKLLGSLPRTGVPPSFTSLEELVEYVAWGRRGGLFPDASFLWWDLRPHPKLGTIELRAADSQTRVADASAVTALVHCLAVWLAERHRRGETLPIHDTHRIAENHWRAMRYGVRGELVDLDTGAREPARTRIARLVDSLEPIASSLECADELTWVRTLLAGTGADRQRHVAEREGLVGLTAWLARETERAQAP